MNMTLNDYIDHARNHEYMSGVERDKLRIKESAEVFTPTWLVQKMLDNLEDNDPTIFSDPSKTFLDNSCGDGQFLSEVIIRKIGRQESIFGSFQPTFRQALSTTYGVELMEDNVKLCRKRLAGPNPDDGIWEILNKNIVHHDALTYDYSFGELIGIEKWTGEKLN